LSGTTRFATLARTVLGQRLSESAASAIIARVERAIGLTPEAVVVESSQGMRGAGVSGRKSEYLRGTARAVLSKRACPQCARHARRRAGGRAPDASAGCGQVELLDLIGDTEAPMRSDWSKSDGQLPHREHLRQNIVDTNRRGVRWIRSWGYPASPLTDNGCVGCSPRGIAYHHSRPTTRRPAARSSGSTRRSRALDVRILTEEGEMPRHLTLDPTTPSGRRDVLMCPRCRDTSVHDVLRHHMVGLSARVCNRGASIATGVTGSTG